MEFIKQNKKIVIIVVTIIFIIGGIIAEKIWESNTEEILNEDTANIIKEEKSEEFKQTEIKENSIEEMEENVDEKTKIYVYVTGEVKVRGVVILDEGSRISDAIESSGGITENADISKINLVYVLSDGMKVTIPNKNQVEEDTNFNYVITEAGENETTEISKQKNSLTSKPNAKININTASQTELETLPGVGPSIALSIINYRKENGKFNNIEDVQNVSGIGESKFNKIKEYITT